jgi:hypothetical protein
MIGSDAGQECNLEEQVEVPLDYLLNKGIANDAQRCAFKHLRQSSVSFGPEQGVSKILTGYDHANGAAASVAPPIWGPDC